MNKVANSAAMTGPIIPADQWPEWADRHCWDERGIGQFIGIQTDKYSWRKWAANSGIPRPAGWDWHVPVMRHQTAPAIDLEKMALLPCPFCGSPDVKLVTILDAGGDILHAVGCPKCGCNGTPHIAAMDDPRPAAAAAWNQRAALLTVPPGWKLVPADPGDAQRLDWLEDFARHAYMYGVSFDWAKPCEGEPGGFRFMTRHRLDARQPTLRAAIDAAKAVQP